MLKIDHLCVHYGDLQVLWDVSLDVKKGELVALIGSNGTGKSTLLKSVSGLLPPTSGKITYNDILLNHLKPHEIVAAGISMVPEGRRLFPGMTVLANLELGAFHPSVRKEKAAILEWVYGIFPVLKQRSSQIAGSLSGGEQQMLAIGRALMAKNEILLLDEMSLGLAPLLVRQIFGVVVEINKTGMGVLIVEQNVPMTLRIADRAYILENGRIVRHDDAKLLLNDPDVKEAYLGMRRAADTAPRQG